MLKNHIFIALMEIIKTLFLILYIIHETFIGKVKVCTVSSTTEYIEISKLE